MLHDAVFKRLVGQHHNATADGKSVDCRRYCPLKYRELLDPAFQGIAEMMRNVR